MEYLRRADFSACLTPRSFLSGIVMVFLQSSDPISPPSTAKSGLTDVSTFSSRGRCFSTGNLAGMHPPFFNPPLFPPPLPNNRVAAAPSPPALLPMDDDDTVTRASPPPSLSPTQSPTDLDTRNLTGVSSSTSEERRRQETQKALKRLRDLVRIHCPTDYHRGNKSRYHLLAKRSDQSFVYPEAMDAMQQQHQQDSTMLFSRPSASSSDWSFDDPPTAVLDSSTMSGGRDSQAATLQSAAQLMRRWQHDCSVLELKHNEKLLEVNALHRSIQSVSYIDYVSF